MEIVRTMHDFQEQCQTVVRAAMCLSISIFSLKQCIIKQLLNSVFVISGLIKVSVSVISLSVRLGFVRPIPQNIEKSVEKVSKKRK